MSDAASVPRLASTLSEAEWAEIRSLLGQGKAHPDPAVAQAALDWAREQTRGRIPIVGGVVVAAALDALLGGVPILGDLSGRAEARDARRLARSIDRAYSAIVGRHGSFLPRERVSVQEIAARHTPRPDGERG